MPVWLRSILWLAAVKTLVGLGFLLVEFDSLQTEWERGLLQILQIFLFSACAVLLLYGARRDLRAAYFGGVLLLAASTSASAGFILSNNAGPGWFRGLSATLAYLNPDAFIPLLTWVFFREFPRTRTHSGLGRKIPALMIRVSAIAGLLLFVVAAVTPIAGSSWRRVIVGPAFSLAFWAVIAGLTLPALGYSFRKVKAAERDEQRRTWLFMLGFALGAGPLFIAYLVGAIWPAFGEVLGDPSGGRGLRLALNVLPLTIPILTGYAVLVHEALDVRLVIRKAIRYAFARFTVLAATAAPFAVVVVYLIRHRHESISGLLSGVQLAGLFSVGVLGLVLLSSRRTILRLIDRRFFRDQYDAYEILSQVVEKSRAATDTSELSVLLTSQADEALHLENATALFLTPQGTSFRCPDRKVQDLAVSSILAQMIAGSRESMDIGIENPSSPLRRLPLEERQWLADGAFRLVTPLTGASGDLVGILALGRKRSELGFSSEDRALLTSAAASAASALEGLRRDSADFSARAASDAVATDVMDDPAGECVTCGAIYPRIAQRCEACGGEIKAAALPQRPIGKYLLRRRLGAGGMGVVYLARDLELARDVAIKTLPRLSPERSMRLRREARVMASLTHPNTATVYGLDIRRGVPLLVLEYLAGGTVRDHLAERKYQPLEVLKLGVDLSGALEAAHSSGVLHRDIKPSNVGYTNDGKPKLMDFGLAKIIVDLHAPDDPDHAISATTLTDLRSPEIGTIQTVGPVGTPAYLAPEALLGEPPGPFFDLWSLSVLLVEALTGTNPLQGRTREETMRMVSRAVVPSLFDLMPDCPPPLATFLDSCLHEEPLMRPPTAAAFRTKLESLQSDLDPIYQLG